MKSPYIYNSKTKKIARENLVTLSSDFRLPSAECKFRTKTTNALFAYRSPVIDLNAIYPAARHTNIGVLEVSVNDAERIGFCRVAG